MPVSSERVGTVRGKFAKAAYRELCREVIEMVGLAATRREVATSLLILSLNPSPESLLIAVT